MYKEKKIDVVTLACCLDRLEGIATEVYEQLDNFDLCEGIRKVVEELKNNFSDVPATKAEKIMRIYLDPDQMETVNKALNYPDFTTDSWVCKKVYLNTPALKEYTDSEKEKALLNDEIDYLIYKT